MLWSLVACVDRELKRLQRSATGLLPEVLHTDLLSRIITARNTVVFRMSRCSSLPKYIRHVCTFSPNIFCVCFFTNHKNNGRKKVYIIKLKIKVFKFRSVPSP